MWLHEQEQCLMWSCSSKSSFSSPSTPPPPPLRPSATLPQKVERQAGEEADNPGVCFLPAHCCFCLAGDRSRSGTSRTSNISEASRSIASRACKSHCPELITHRRHTEQLSWWVAFLSHYCWHNYLFPFFTWAFSSSLLLLCERILNSTLHIIPLGHNYFKLHTIMVTVFRWWVDNSWWWCCGAFVLLSHPHQRHERPKTELW